MYFLLKQKFYSTVIKHIQFCKWRKKDILIIDDILPSLLSPWRTFEFNELVKHNSNSSVISDLGSFIKYNNGESFNSAMTNLRNIYPHLASRIKPLKLFTNINCKLAYVVFLGNCKKYLPFFEKYKIPFVFTLYPGGGFILNNERIDNELKKIFKSNFFRGVIVNQFLIKEYLIGKNLCAENKIHLFHGVPINLQPIKRRISIPAQNGTTHLLFIAHKYSRYGFDKGFDLFQLIVKYLLDFGNNIKAHVVGDFTEMDILNQDIIRNIEFYGLITENNLDEVLTKTNFVISPNRPNVLSDGAFDGFPLGSSVIAGLYGNILCLTDSFNESEKAGWIDEMNYIKISYDPYESAKKINKYIADKNICLKLAENSEMKLQEHYSYKKQIEPRLQLFKGLIK